MLKKASGAIQILETAELSPANYSVERPLALELPAGLKSKIFVENPARRNCNPKIPNFQMEWSPVQVCLPFFFN